jgi:hypothetical protein
MLFNYLIRKFTKFLRKLLLGDFRQCAISKEIVNLITANSSKIKIKIIDYGSGYFKPTIAEKVYNLLSLLGRTSVFVCLDLYTRKDLKGLNSKKNKMIKYYNVNYLKKTRRDKFDYCIISDVLHHIRNDKTKKIGCDNKESIIDLLKNIKRKAKNIIIKDHYESNLYDRFLLLILDFMGNYQNFTTLPKKYFTEKLFNQILKESKLKVVNKIYNRKYYPNFFLFFSKPSIHFMYLLK